MFRPELVAQALVVQHREDGSGSPYVAVRNKDGSTDFGCMQINSVHYSGGKWFGRWPGHDAVYDADTNVAMAAALQADQAWRPWCSARFIYWNPNTERGCGSR